MRYSSNSLYYRLSTKICLVCNLMGILMKCVKT